MTARPITIIALIISGTSLLACLGIGKDSEGANAGECSDGADNDEDGDFDCDDEDCQGSPDCDEPEDTESQTDDTESQPDDTNPWVGDTEIDNVEYSYSASSWYYKVLLHGWGDAVTLDISQDTSSPWEERHDLANTDFDDHGSWDLWEITLPVTSDWSQQTSGVNTFYPGSDNFEATMVWRMEVWSEGSRVDCVVWAGDSADASILMESGCREISF